MNVIFRMSSVFINRFIQCKIPVIVMLVIGLVTERLRVRLTPGPLQATWSKLLTYCMLRPNSASYPQRDLK